MKVGQKTEKSEQTKQRLLEAALKLFLKKGFDKTTMRDIAAECDMAVGATYYYFRKKDDMVLAYYEQTQVDADAKNIEILRQHRGVEARIKALIEFKLEQLRPYRCFVHVLARTAADPNSPLSPFSPETKEIRDRAILLFEQILNGADLKAAATLYRYLPTLLWLYQMGIIFFWIRDSSPNQQRTTKLVEQSLPIILRLTRLTTLPLIGRLVKPLTSLIELVINEQPKGVQVPCPVK